MELSITEQQSDVLRDILDSALRDLRFEIADTDNAEYKRRLRARESTLRELLSPLGGPLQSAGT